MGNILNKYNSMPIRIPFDYVHVKPNPTNSLILAGKKFYLDTRFEDTKHAPTCGVVLQVPERLRFKSLEEAESDHPSLDFDTEMELQVGDTVIFHYLAEDNAKRNGLYHEDGLFLHYDKIFCAIRNGEIIPINGHLIVEPESEMIKSNLVIPDLAIRNSKQKGTVKYAGKPNKRYRWFPEAYDSELKAGDKIIFHFADAVPLQHDAEIHGVIEKRNLYRMQGKDVIAMQ